MVANTVVQLCYNCVIMSLNPRVLFSHMQSAEKWSGHYPTNWTGSAVPDTTEVAIASIHVCSAS